MTIKVLVVDDSGFFRRRLSEIINSSDQLEVVGTADNGRDAVIQTLKLKPDVITMDYEMPIMDGISAVKQIMREQPTPILMFSSLTYEGARVTLDSLEAGAVDYLPKNFEEISKTPAALKQKLVERILMVAKAGSRAALNQTLRPVPPEPPPPGREREVDTLQRAPVESPIQDSTVSTPRRKRKGKDFEVVLIGTSTGGPVALLNVLSQLPPGFSIPIVLIQHMPATFTKAFADRLNSLCRITVSEAKDGDTLKPGVALLAPGGKQLMITKGGRVRVLPGDDRLNYKPCVDVTFGSAANVFADKVLGIVLTGMGADGCEGAKLLKQKGAEIWAQDEETSVIFGMPAAIISAELASEILPLPEVGARLNEIS